MDTSFKDVQFWQSRFIRCVFTGPWENIVLYGPEAPDGWQCSFEEVDMTGVTATYVDFRKGFDTASVRLPEGVEEV